MLLRFFLDKEDLRFLNLPSKMVLATVSARKEDFVHLSYVHIIYTRRQHKPAT
jgi:hypothetical protein